MPAVKPSVPAIPFDVERGRADLSYFATYFFPRHCRLNFSRLHEYLFERRAIEIASIPPDRRGRMDVVIAPRGSAKSTLMSLVFPIHALVYALDPYIVLFSATQRQASQRLANIRSMLIDNAALAAAFPGLAGGKRAVRASTQTLSIGDCRMDAFSGGAEVRGVSHGPWRPTWIILDDIERSDRVRSARHRDALAEWFDEVIANLGNGYTNIDLIGTLLHREALPARISSRPDAHSVRFASIENEALDEKLWDRWRALYHDLNDPDRLATARAFFDERHDEMLAGAQVLWPEKEDYHALCALRERIGRRAFDKEKQNAPADDLSAMFTASQLRRFKIDGDKIVCEPMRWSRDGHPSDAARPSVDINDLRIGGYFDPSEGTGNDYAAIVIVGMDSVGYMYVLDVWLEQTASPAVQTDKVLDLCGAWKCEVFGVETATFQGMFIDRIEDGRRVRIERGEHLPFNLVGKKPILRKISRIARIEPHVGSGWLMFNQDLGRLFFDQIETFPTGRHDDGPDALAGAFELMQELKSGPIRSAAAPRRPRGAVRSF